MWVLLPAAVTVVALVVLVVGLRTVARDAAGLIGSLRRSAATAVAADELARRAALLGDHAEATRSAVDRVRDRRRRSSRPQGRR